MNQTPLYTIRSLIYTVKHHTHSTAALVFLEGYDVTENASIHVCMWPCPCYFCHSFSTKSPRNSYLPFYLFCFSVFCAIFFPRLLFSSGSYADKNSMFRWVHSILTPPHLPLPFPFLWDAVSRFAFTLSHFHHTTSPSYSLCHPKYRQTSWNSYRIYMSYIKSF